MTPPYHLRQNKAIDRFLLIELLKRLFKIPSINSTEYSYCSLSGAFLEDSKLIHHYFPEIKLISVEKDLQVHKRQGFHKFCRHIELQNVDMRDFISSFTAGRYQKHIFWLDCTDFKYEDLTSFGNLLTKVNDYSVVRITVQCTNRNLKNELSRINDEEARSNRLKEYQDEFVKKFAGLIPDAISSDSFTVDEKYRMLVQGIVAAQSKKSLPAEGERIFQFINSTSYADTVGMLSITGVVVPVSAKKSAKNTFRDWKFCNLEWKAPIRIDVPTLSIQERLYLQKHLPLRRGPTKTYLKKLGYLLDKSESKHRKLMEYYADFSPYYPYFAKITV